MCVCVYAVVPSPSSLSCCVRVLYSVLYLFFWVWLNELSNWIKHRSCCSWGRYWCCIILFAATVLFTSYPSLLPLRQARPIPLLDTEYSSFASLLSKPRGNPGSFLAKRISKKWETGSYSYPRLVPALRHTTSQAPFSKDLASYHLLASTKLLLLFLFYPFKTSLFSLIFVFFISPSLLSRIPAGYLPHANPH